MALDFGIWHTQLKKMCFGAEYRRPWEVAVLGQNFLPYILATERKPKKCSCSGPLSQFKRINLVQATCAGQCANTLTSWKKTSVPIGTSHTIRVPASPPACISDTTTTWSLASATVPTFMNAVESPAHMY